MKRREEKRREEKRREEKRREGFSFGENLILMAMFGYIVIGCEDVTLNDEQLFLQEEQLFLQEEQLSLQEEISAREEQISEDNENLHFPTIPLEFSMHCDASGCEIDEQEVTSTRYRSVVSTDFPNVRHQQAQNQLFQEQLNETKNEAFSRCYHANEVIINEDDSIRTNIESQRIQLSLHLSEEPFDFTRFREARTELQHSLQVESLIEERSRQLSDSQIAVSHIIREHNGVVINNLWTSNTLIVELDICEVESVLERMPHLISAEFLQEGYFNNYQYANGIERRRARGFLYPGLSGSDGHLGEHQEIIIGVIDFNYLNPLLAYEDGPPENNLPNRVTRFDCRGGICEDMEPESTCLYSHSNRVMSVVLADFTDQQDPDMTWSLEQQYRSGILPEAEGIYYRINTMNDAAAAVELAIEHEVDILNLSVGVWCEEDGEAVHCQCRDQWMSQNGLRQAIVAATNAGILVVVAAGNDGEQSECNVNSLAALPDTLAVGGTDFAKELNDNNSVSYHNASSHGQWKVDANNGADLMVNPVDLVANFNVANVPDYPDHYFYGMGTSYSTPVITGLAGAWLDWTHDANWPSWTSDPYTTRTVLSLMGDGRVGTGSNSFGYSLGSHMGFGTIRFIRPDQDIGNGGFGIHRSWVNHGSQVTYTVGGPGPESDDVNGWKFVALMDYDGHYIDVPDATFQLVDTCPASGTEVVIRTARTYALKARMRFRAHEMETKFHNRCLEVRATIDSPYGNPFSLYMADYYYTNERINHDAQ